MTPTLTSGIPFAADDLSGLILLWGAIMVIYGIYGIKASECLHLIGGLVGRHHSISLIAPG